MRPQADLDGLVIMVTRPAHQAGPLCEKIESLGGRVICFPVLEIAAVEETDALRDLIGRLHEFDIAIFISVNAVARGVPMVLARGDWPPGTRVAAVGERTARELMHVGLRVDIRPDAGFDSEHLLATADLADVAGRRIVIFRGQGGRELLAETLRGRGARVEYAEVYRRVRPSATLSEALRTQPFPDAIVVTSGEGLHNLCAMTEYGGRQRLLSTPLVVVSERIADTARALGFDRAPIVARRASDDAIVAAITRWWAGKNNTESKLQ
jgi:uroporphyrinogen-III synthase